MSERLRISASSRFHTVCSDRTVEPEDMIAYFVRMGFGGIDFDIETVPDMGDGWRERCASLAERVAAAGLCMDFGHLPFHKVPGADGKPDPQAFSDRMMQCIEAAGIMGIRHAVIHPLNPRVIADGADPFAANMEYLSPFNEFAHKVGVSLAVENMPGYSERDGIHRFGASAEDVLALSDALDCGNCWDFGHANISGVPQGDSLRLLGHRLTVLHVNDNHGKEDEHLLPFFGNIKWRDAMRGLRESGFDGCFNLECRMIRLPYSVRDTLGAYALSVADALLDMYND